MNNGASKQLSLSICPFNFCIPVHPTCICLSIQLLPVYPFIHDPESTHSPFYLIIHPSLHPSIHHPISQLVPNQIAHHVTISDRPSAKRNTLFAAIRTRTTLPPQAVELAITRVAVLNRAWYEFEHHAPLLLEAGFSREEGMRYVFAAKPFEHPPQKEEEKENPVVSLDEQALAILAYVDFSTLKVAVPEAVVLRLSQSGFSDRQVFEVAAVCAGYNCVSRVLVGLDVSERNGRRGMEDAIRVVGLEDVLGGLEPVKIEGREDW